MRRGGGGRLGPLGACSLLLVVLVLVVVESGRAAPARHHQSTPQHHAADEGGLTTEEEGQGGARAKRHLIGTPSLPLMMDPRRKRPFCNAFTGCGRKRSDEGLAPEQGLDETMGTLVELNSEPAVAELSRQILSEAKLWEAIQEARQEMMARQRQRQQAAMASQRRRRRRESGPAEAAEGGQMGRRAPPESDLLPPAIPKGTLPSAGNGALPIV